jgi:hypothetical protein
VIIFLTCTGGLLLWAVAKPWVDAVREKRIAPIRSSVPPRGFGAQRSGSRRRHDGGGLDEDEEPLRPPTR